MGTTATTVYKRIAAMIAEKHSKPYSRTMHLIRCRLSFSLLRSAIMCLRGSRSTLHCPAGMLISSHYHWYHEPSLFWGQGTKLPANLEHGTMWTNKYTYHTFCQSIYVWQSVHIYLLLVWKSVCLLLLPFKQLRKGQTTWDICDALYFYTKI